MIVPAYCLKRPVRDAIDLRPLDSTNAAAICRKRRSRAMPRCGQSVVNTAFTVVFPELLPNVSDTVTGFFTPVNVTGEPAASNWNLLLPNGNNVSSRFAPFTVP